MKVKIIDILVKLANGEKVPPIKYYNRNDMQKIVMLTCKENILYRLNDGSICLNDEVEIIEEPKEIEKPKNYEDFESIDDYIEHLRDKIVELTDVVNELKKENK